MAEAFKEERRKYIVSRICLEKTLHSDPKTSFQMVHDEELPLWCL